MFVIVVGGGTITIGILEVAVIGIAITLMINNVVPGSEERYANAISSIESLATQATDSIKVLFAKKEDIRWVDYLERKYGLSPDQREWLHQQMKQHGLTPEEIEEEAAEIQRENQKKNNSEEGEDE